MRLPNSTHERHPWVIAKIAPDFDLLDVWGLPVEGGRDDFNAFLGVLGHIDPAGASFSATHALSWIRHRLGSLLGWDDPTVERAIPGCVETTLSARLSEDLQGTADDSAIPSLLRAGGFKPLYRTDSEAAAEIANSTVHGVLHLAWAEQENGLYRAQMGVYVKPRGALGEVYLKLIQPFRHLIVYPALMRGIGRAWETQSRRSVERSSVDRDTPG